MKKTRVLFLYKTYWSCYACSCSFSLWLKCMI